MIEVLPSVRKQVFLLKRGEGLKVGKRCAVFVLSVMMVWSIAGCAGRQPVSSEPLSQATPDPSAYSKKVDTLIVVMDVSTSSPTAYQERRKIERIGQAVSQINRALPALDYKSVLVGISSGSCFNCEDAQVLFGPAPHGRAEFEAALAGFKRGGEGRSINLMLGGSLLMRAILQEDPGRVAMIMVSDAESVFHGRTVLGAQKLKGVLGDRLCIYPVQVGRDDRAAIVMEKLANLGGCGFAVNAGNLASPEAMAAYVNEIFWAPAAVRTAAASTVPAGAAGDADGDGVPDSRDKCPNTPRGARTAADGCWSPQAVYFDPGQAVIKDPRALDEAVAVLKANPGLSGEVHGHADSSASAEFNLKLSAARAEALRAYFVQQGIASERFRVAGFGETRPTASNDNAAGRALNRRAEFHPAGK
jgi:OOP family OmpA-OmpF porin